MGRNFKPYHIDAHAAAEQLGIDEQALYRYARQGQVHGLVHFTDETANPPTHVLRFDRRKLALNVRAPGRPRIHEPGSGRTQVTHSPAQLRAWTAKAKAEGYSSLAKWIAHAANHRAGVK